MSSSLEWIGKKHFGLCDLAMIKNIYGTDGIPVELFQILEDDAVKVLH